MTQLEWQQLEETVAHMTPHERNRLAELLRKQRIHDSTSTSDPLLGLMSDNAELVDQIVEEALAARERDPLRDTIDCPERANCGSRKA